MKKINAVLTVRKIRDKQTKDTSGKSPQETIEYFRKKADKIAEKVKVVEGLNES